MKNLLLLSLILSTLLFACEKDSDGDGVSDDIDMCPNTEIGVEVTENGCALTPIYLDGNGVTIKCRNDISVGYSGDLDGVTYTVVDEEQLREMVNNDEDVSNVCTSKITNMNTMFLGKVEFNCDISSWDVSNVTDMSYMFSGGIISYPYNKFAFKGDISNWDVSQVTNMNGMFSNNPTFNSNISSWDLSNVVDMSGMFERCYSFNQNLSTWNVSSVTDMSYMFYLCTMFNQDLSGWCVTNIISEPYHFSDSSQLDQNNNPIWGACPE